MKYVYIVRYIHDDDLQTPLNDLGDEGYELVSCDLPFNSHYYIVVLKRPKQDEPAKKPAKRAIV